MPQFAISVALRMFLTAAISAVERLDEGDEEGQAAEVLQAV
jgi:hypothetical protein